MSVVWGAHASGQVGVGWERNVGFYRKATTPRREYHIKWFRNLFCVERRSQNTALSNLSDSLRILKTSLSTIHSSHHHHHHHHCHSVTMVDFGYGVGDIITVTKLAYDIYVTFRDPVSEFAELAEDAHSVSIILEQIQPILKWNDLPPSSRKHLDCNVQRVGKLLGQMYTEMIKHGRLQNASRARLIDRAKWLTNDMPALRERLSRYTTLLNTSLL